MEPTQPEWMSAEHMMGTTIMAVEFEGGVVLGADSRTSNGGYVANRVSDKITGLHEKIFACRSGSAADTQMISDNVMYSLDMHSTMLGEAPLVKTAANMVQQMCYTYKEQLLAGMIVAGWDKHLGGQVYTIPLGGVRVREPYALGGSGSAYIFGFCDVNYRPGMTKEETVEFVRNAIANAIARDGSSGGVIRTLVITEKGVEREMLPGNKLPRFNEF